MLPFHSCRWTAWSTRGFSLPLTRNAGECFLPGTRAHRPLRRHETGATAPEATRRSPPSRPSPAARSGPAFTCESPRAGRHPSPGARSTRPRRVRVCIANLPGSNHPPRGGPGPSPATPTLAEAAPTGARAAAGSGAGATAPAPSGSGRRRGSSSLPGPAGRGRGRPAPGGSEGPAAAASPAPMPWRGRRQWRAEGKASDPGRCNTVPRTRGAALGRGGASAQWAGRLRFLPPISAAQRKEGGKI